MTAAERDGGTNRQPAHQVVVVPTSSWHAGMACFLVPLEGVLEAGRTDRGEYCVWLRTRQRAVPVVWPAGFRARLDPLELLNAEGKVVARGGDWISVAGAELPADPESRCMLGQDRAFHVQDEMRQPKRRGPRICTTDRRFPVPCTLLYHLPLG